MSLPRFISKGVSYFAGLFSGPTKSRDAPIQNPVAKPTRLPRGHRSGRQAPAKSAKRGRDPVTVGKFSLRLEKALASAAVGVGILGHKPVVLLSTASLPASAKAKLANENHGKQGEAVAVLLLKVGNETPTGRRLITGTLSTAQVEDLKPATPEGIREAIHDGILRSALKYTIDNKFTTITCNNPRCGRLRLLAKGLRAPGGRWRCGEGGVGGPHISCRVASEWQ